MCAVKFVVIFGLAVSMMSAEQAKYVSLNPDIIAIIDGKSIGIYGELVGAMYKIARDVQALRLGKITSQGRVGMYQYSNKPHSINSLAVIEQNCTDDNDKQELKKLLIHIRNDFYAIVSPFLGQAKGAKGPMLLLMSESCPNSLLLDWAKSTEDEAVAIEKTVTSFEIFDHLCADLVKFLGDLLHSCPKARAQFEKLKEDYIRKQQAQRA